MKVKSIHIINILAVVWLLSLNLIAFAQKTDKTSLDRGKPEVKKNEVKKPEVKRPEVKPTPQIIKPDRKPEPKVAIVTKPRVKPAVPKQKASRFVKVLFTTPETGLEIEIDKKSFYVNKKAQIEVPLTVGIHSVYIKRNGQRISSELELTVSPNQDDIDLSPYVKNYVEAKPESQRVTATDVEQKTVQDTGKIEPSKPSDSPVQPEEKVVNKSVGLNLVSQNIDNILLRFVNSKQIEVVSSNEWQYVYDQTSQNQILPRYTKEKMNLINKFAEGQVNLFQSNYTQALNSFSGAVSISLLLKDKLREETPLPYYGVGLAYFALKDYERASQSFLQSVRIDSKFGMAYSRLGDTYKALGRDKDALSYYLSAYKYGYKTSDSSLKLANSLKKYESYEEAIKIYQDLVEKEKPLPEIYISIGDCFVQLKQNGRAIDNYKKAVEVDPKSAVGYASLGELYLEIKDFQLAIESWQKSLDIDKEGKLIDRKKVTEKINKAKKKLK
jgi:tetratricopeptide (TPR) repeat protein